MFTSHYPEHKTSYSFILSQFSNHTLFIGHPAMDFDHEVDYDQFTNLFQQLFYAGGFFNYLNQESALSLAATSRGISIAVREFIGRKWYFFLNADVDLLRYCFFFYFLFFS